MIRTINTCPKCGKETSIVTDKQNERSYKEELTHYKCNGCIDIPKRPLIQP